MNFISLFTGIGGFDVAFERAGMTCVYQVEIERNCNRVLERHWPNVQRMKDVREFTRRNYGDPVDLVCGGFPCQDLSVAGRRAGLDGERSGLWFEFLRVIQEFAPKWVAIENVPGLLSSYSGENPPSDLHGGDRWETTETSDLSVIFQGLAECGYWWAYRVLDAQYWGVPQRRRRVFIVASLGDWAGPAQVLFESESIPWDTAPSRQAGAKVARSLAAGAHASGFNGQDADRGNVVNCFNGYTGGADDNDAQAGHVLPVAFQPRYYTRDNKTGGAPSETADITNAHKAGDSAPVFAFNWQASAHQSLADSIEQSPSLRTSQTPAVLCADVSPTLQKESYSPTKTSTGQALDWCIVQRPGVRRFTPTECEKLQGFAPGWTAHDAQGKPISDSARYRMLGNAVAVPVVEWLGRRIMLQENAK